jgi:hypothetical protein
MDHSARCPGCGLDMPVRPGATTHRYFNASPECWDVFGEVLATEYGDAVRFAATHQLAVDSYAAQHAGGDHPDTSVAIHLVGLHLILEAEVRPTAVPPQLQSLATVTSTWPSLGVPPGPWSITVLDVALAADPIATTRAWAEEIWHAWHDAHDAVRRLAAPLGRPTSTDA